MWAHPGKKLLFMGGELGQWREWNDAQSLDWHLLDEEDHRGVRLLVRDLNNLVSARPALYELDVEPRGFRWIDVDNASENVVSFFRLDSEGNTVVCVCNFSAVPRHGYRFGLPEPGAYKIILNTDAPVYAGGGHPQAASVEAEERPWHDLPFSASVDLPPLTTLWLEGPAKVSPVVKPNKPRTPRKEAAAAPEKEPAKKAARKRAPRKKPE
jgi:1,4-alpha-glucan branching enzyme